jgi:hypothetical protein
MTRNMMTPFFSMVSAKDPWPALYSTKEKAAVKTATVELFRSRRARAASRARRAEGERDEERRAAVAAESTVGLEIEVADDVVAAAGPHPVGPALLVTYGLKMPSTKETNVPTITPNATRKPPH